MKKFLAIASFLASAVAASAAQAGSNEVWPNWYVGLSGGVTYLSDSDVSGTSVGTLSYDTGWNVNASLGYILPVGYNPLGSARLEFEAGYHQSGLDNTVLSGTSTASPGTARISSYMINGYYDFRSSSHITPYLGAGFGLARVGISHDSGLGNTADDMDTVIAYQGMAGIAYAPSGMPNTEWTLGYRYFVADSPEFRTSGGKVKLDDVTSHSAEIGGRFKF